MPGITSISQTSGVCEPDGGIYTSFGTACSNITGVTVDTDGQITNFTMATANQWGELNFTTSDDSAFFNETSTRNGNKLEYAQNAYFKFEQITSAKVKAADDAAAECCTVFIHLLNSGINRVQGIDVDKTAGTWKFTKKNALVNPNAQSDTSANADRVEYNVLSTAKKLAATTTLDAAAIRLL